MSKSPKDSSLPLPRKSFAADPVHVRIAELCREAILKGDFAVGEKFPSERELAERYSVSRATANKVISMLITEGLLELQKGIGTRVQERRTLFASLSGMESFTGHVRERGLEPATEVLCFEKKRSSALPPEVLSGLGMESGCNEPVVYIERLRLADGVPMIFESRWVRESLAPGLEQADVEESFYRVLEEKFALPMTGEEHSISAVLLTKDSARRFGEKGPFPALQVEGTGFVKGDEPLWYQQLLYRGDRYQLYNKTRGPAASAVELRLYEGRLTA